MQLDSSNLNKEENTVALEFISMDHYDDFKRKL